MTGSEHVRVPHSSWVVRSLILAAFVAASFVIAPPGTGAAVVRADTTDCPFPSSLPTAALPPARPAWCDPLTSGRSTFVEGQNAWLDEWNHGLMMADLGEGYREFPFGSVYRTATFRHNEHWMQDVAGAAEDRTQAPWNVGGVSMRPDRSFQFVDGKLVIEADVAAGVADYGGSAWPEITVTTAPAPTKDRRDALYHYDRFAGAWTLGCRLPSDRKPVCAMFDNTDRGPGDGGRVFEVSNFQDGGGHVFGGGPFTPELDAAWRICQGTDPDTNCRDRFRWEIERTQLTLYVNGVMYMQHSDLPDKAALPAALTESPVYVYLAGVVYKPSGETVRFHWDRLAINPEGGPSAAPVADSQPAHMH
jgi:hypothetical protein